MNSLRWFILTMGILHLLLAVAFFLGGGYIVGKAWLGAYDMYGSPGVLETPNPARMRAVGLGRYAVHAEPGSQEADNQARKGYMVVRLAALAFALTGLTMITVAIVSRPPPAGTAPAVQP